MKVRVNSIDGTVYGNGGTAMCLSKRNPDTGENPRVHSGSINTQSKVFDTSTEAGTKAAKRFKAHLEDSGYYRVTTVPAGLDSVRITGETVDTLLLPNPPNSGDLNLEVFPSNCWDENGMFHLPVCDEMSAANKRKADFWYGIPGGWYGIPGAWYGDSGGPTSNPYVVVDSARIFDAVAYFKKHRNVVVLSTGWPVQNYGAGGIRINYAFKARG